MIDDGWGSSGEWGGDAFGEPQELEQFVHLDEDEDETWFGYEVVSGALAVAVVVSFLKVLLLTAHVLYALFSTALQYSIVAVVLIAVVIYFG